MINFTGFYRGLRSFKAVVMGMTFLGLSIAHGEMSQDFLVKIDPQTPALANLMAERDLRFESLGFNNWYRVHATTSRGSRISVRSLSAVNGVLSAQPNYKIRMIEDMTIKDASLREHLVTVLQNRFWMPPAWRLRNPVDNPEFVSASAGGTGLDPLFQNQWGMTNIGVERAWQAGRGSQQVVVAVIDTGVDYTHEDLAANMWKNPGESGFDAQGRDRSANGVDDDNNGYVDDLVGWDMVENDNKPYDMSGSLIQILLQGANPGHGTHCAGNIAASFGNGKGITGVAPNVKIMALRFLPTSGGGDTAGAVRAIRYAVDMGAKILSNSWGSEGEEAGNNTLREAIQYAESRGVLFVAAAGNGRQGQGYDNDSDARPAYPASYPHANIVSVAAMDSENAMGSFSNFGQQTVDLGAPGVKIMSTVPQNGYEETLIDIGPLKANWDGTSMATPHVAGAAALYWSLHPNKTMAEVKAALLSSALATPALSGKSVTGGRLNVERLMSVQ